MDEWWNSGYELYHPQGYTAYETHDREWEMYALAVIDFDLYVYYCFSVRHRPYLASDEWLSGNPHLLPSNEMRDHLFVEFPIMKRTPEQTEPEFRIEWMGAPHEPFDENSATYREVMASFMDFIDEGRP
jgi:hypothetical protein